MKWRIRAHACENALRWFVKLPKSGCILNYGTDIDGFQKNNNGQEKLIRRVFLEKRNCILRVIGNSYWQYNLQSLPLYGWRTWVDHWLCASLSESSESSWCLWEMLCPAVGDVCTHMHTHAPLWLQRGSDGLDVLPLSREKSSLLKSLFFYFYVNPLKVAALHSQKLSPRTGPT